MRLQIDSKEKAKQLADLLARTEGEQILRLMHELPLFEAPETGAPPQEAERVPVAIGIWEAQQQTDGIHFVRSNRFRTEWSGWANVEEIGPRSAKRRIVMIGESVAHGWFLAPAFTPAKALQQMLGDGAEVIDLSRINMGLPQAAQLNALAVKHLSPDVIVHFSGNNWGPAGLLPNLARTEYAGLPFTQVIERRKEELTNVVRVLLDNIVTTAKQGSIPLLFVIPEFNFAEWKDSWYSPWLASEKTNEWYENRAAAEKALEDGDIQRCAALAHEMLELDQGELGGSGYDLLARCRMAGGDICAARTLFEKSWDAMYLNSSVPLARCLPANREIIQRTAAASGSMCVDLRSVFDEHKGESPSFFVDYCHLSVEGIRIAMASVAQALLGPGDYLDRCECPPHSVDVANRFALTLQNSALPDGVIERHLSVLADDSPDWIPLLLELAAGSAPVWMNQEFSRLFASHLESIQYLRDFAYASDWNVALSQNLIDMAIRVLNDRGLPGRDAVDALLARNHSVGNTPLDLLTLRYNFLSLQKREFLWTMPEPVRNLLLPSSSFYRAYEGKSPFVFVSREPVCFSITYRTPNTIPDGAGVAVYVNGRRQTTMPSSGSWRTCRFPVTGPELEPGRNWLHLEWPPLGAGAETALRHAAGQMQRGRVPELYPVFGEIHALSVQTLSA